MVLARQFYNLAIGLRKLERRGLVSQIRRSGISIPGAIAEGAGLTSDRELVRIHRSAYGSVCEFETQLLLAHDLEYPTGTQRSLMTTKAEEARPMVFAVSESILCKTS
jgi:four helix bundle protein